MEEQWRDVPEYVGYYEVSDRGRVRRSVNAPREGRTWPGKLLKPDVRNGYEHVALCTNGRARVRSVHNLVALAFVGPRPDGFCVNHIDGNKRNNLPPNLEWTDLASNTRHAFATGLCDNTGEKHGMSKLTNADAKRIREMCAEGSGSQKKIGRMFGVSQTTVSNINRGFGWKAVTHGA